jgi:hypothetical protein
VYKKVFQIIAILLEPVLKRSRYFEFSVETIRENFSNDFDIEP